jgi:hypothetical protein
VSQSDPDIEDLRLKLNRETARLPWHELQRHFAAGIVVEVDQVLDLIDVAVAFGSDDSVAVSSWMAGQQLGKVDDQRAATWLESDVVLWTVVVRPWILVQLAKPGG